MPDPVLKNMRAAIIAGIIVTALLAGAASPLAAQASQQTPLPADQKTSISFASHLLQHWYESEKVHVFLMLDGFTVQQGKWTLRARDGVIWLDEGDIGPDGLKTLGIYAEGAVVINAGGPGKPTEMESVYLTLKTTGDLERPATDEKVQPAERTPLYLRARKTRTTVLAQPQEKVLPETTGTETAAEQKPSQPAESRPAAGATEKPVKKVKPKAGGLAPKDADKNLEMSVEPLDDIRKLKIQSTLNTEKTRRTTIWTGGVQVTRGNIELQADDVIIWTNEGEALKENGQQAEAYLEGHVVINQGYRTLRGSRVYYNFDKQQALIVDATIRSFSTARDVPIYYYAERVRQLAEGRFVAENATFTTSEMGHPQTAISGSEFQIVDLSGTDPETGEPVTRARFDATNVIPSVRGVPVFYWPRIVGDVEQGETALRRVNLTNRTSRGTGIESEWYLWKLFGISEPPQGFEKTYWNMNYYSSRGPYLEARSKYSQENFYGEMLSNFIYDTGKDRIGGDSYDVPQPERGRVLWRHRQFFWEKWQATTEVSWLSDTNYLQQWFEPEFKQGKDQETLLHLKRQDDREAISLLAKYRINQFQTETDQYPRIDYHRIGEPLWQDRLTYFTTSTYDLARYDPAEMTPVGTPPPFVPGSPATSILDTIHEMDYPLPLGPAKVVPFVEGRLSYFEHQLNTGDGTDREYEAAGLRSNWYLSKVYDDVHSDLWDVNRLRHINTFEAAAMEAHSSVPERKLYPYDEPNSDETKLVRGVDSTDVYQLRWKQRWQTKRGAEQRTVDWILFDMLMTWYADTQPPRAAPTTDDAARNNLQTDYAWQVSDTVSLMGDVNYVTNSGYVHQANVGLAVVRSPRFSYYIGDRYIRGASSSIGTFGCDYIINPKWKFHFFQQYEFDQSSSGRGTRFELTRRLDTWDMTVRVELDPGNNEKLFFLQFQPVGVPEVRFGF